LNDALLPELSFPVLADCVPLNLMPSKLHFLEGVFVTAAVGAYAWVSESEVYGGGVEVRFEALGTAAGSVGADRLSSTSFAWADSSA